MLSVRLGWAGGGDPFSVSLTEDFPNWSFIANFLRGYQ